METATTTSGLIPMLFSLVGVLVTLQYLKGMSDISAAIRYLFFGFGFIFVSKLLMFGIGSMGDTYYYFISLLCHLLAAVFFTAGAFGIKGIKFFNRTVIIFTVILALVWSWYVVIITSDGSMLTFSLALSTIGYAALAAAFWRRKNLRNSLGFVITGWICIFLVVYNIVSLMTWGQSLLSPIFETFLYIAIMCGLLLISNNMMAHQFDSLAQEIKDNKERLRLMVQLSPFPIIISRLKGDQLMLMNESAAKLFGVDKKNPGNFKMVDYFAEPSKRTELLARLEKHPVVDDFEFMVKPRQGEPFWLLVSARVFDYEYDVALYMAFQDITDRKKKEIQLFNQATRDPLTNCYNRRQFEEMAKNEVQRSRRYNHAFCLFMIDADHFKNVNDTHGHAVGDLVLQALADCCRRTLRESDIVARFGGEEFVILLPEASIENGHRVAERLRIKISKLVVKNEQNQDVRFTVSMGLVSSTVTDNIAEMLKMADEALYEAKENGRNQVVVYDQSGPNRSIPVPQGEDIEKVKNEPLYYFKPSSMPVVRSHDDEPQETGVVGLDGSVSAYKEKELDRDDGLSRATRGTGVSLNSIYEDDGEDDHFTPTVVRSPSAVPPPVEPEPFEFVTEEEIEIEEAEPLVPENAEEPEITQEEPVKEISEETSEEPVPPPSMSEEDISTLLADTLPDEFPVAEGEVPEEPPLDDEEPYTPPRAPAFEEQDEMFAMLASKPAAVAPAAPVEQKHPAVKKIPIKMPPGMVKVPKMPGVVRVKIPKALHQGPAVPKQDH